MDYIHAHASVSIAELKRNPTAVLEKAEGSPVVVLSNNKPAAYLLSAEAYEYILEQLEDLELAQIVKERESEKRIKVSLNEL